MNAAPVGKPFDFGKFHKIAGHVFFAVMCTYAIVYAMERIAYVDSAWLSFERINGERFSFPGDRYAAFISEIPLFLASTFHLPLKVLMYVFSVSYIVLYFLIWRLCVFTLKNHIAGIVVMFGMVVGVREAFLHTVSETHQCIAYSALLYAVMQHQFKRGNSLKYIFVAFVTLLVLFAHPLGIFTTAFVIVFYFTDNRTLRNPVLWIPAILLVGITVLNLVHPPNVYDEAQYDRLASSVGADSVWDSGALRFLFMHFPHFYWLPELAALIACVWFVLRKEWLRLAITVAGVIGYTIIAAITFRNGDSSIMIERVFLPTFFMINLSLAWLMVNSKINKWIPIALFLFFTINGIRFINAGCLMYKKRTQYLDVLVQQALAQGKDKYILAHEDADHEKILVPWALGTETLIYSTIRYDKSVSITLEPEGCTPEFVRLTTPVCLPVSELNPHFFKLSAAPYERLIMPSAKQ